MITSDYNPSPLEVQMANILFELKDKIGQRLPDYSIVKTDIDTTVDNPSVTFLLKDKDGDQHQLVLKIIQRPDGPNPAS